MNAYARNARAFAMLVSGQPIRGGYEALRQVIDLYDNDDAVAREFAEEAFNDDRPAYWSSATYHNAVACCLLNSANLMHSLEAAIDAEIKPHKRDRIQVYLDTMIPLNAKAERELSIAYSAHTSTWRDEPELAMRRVRDCRKAVA